MGKQDSYTEEKLDYFLTPCTKVNIRPETIKLLAENISRMLFDTDFHFIYIYIYIYIYKERERRKGTKAKINKTTSN